MRSLNICNPRKNAFITEREIICTLKVFEAFRDLFEGIEFKKGDMIRDAFNPEICLRVVSIEPAGYLIKREYNPFGDRDNFIVPFKNAERWVPITYKAGV